MPVAKPTPAMDRANQRKWVSACLEPKTRKLLTDWEEKFICRLDTQLFKGFNLTIKQAETLELIYAEKTR